MASGAAPRAYTSVTNASNVDTVLLSDACNVVTVSNLTPSVGTLWFTVSRPGGSNPQPTVNGSNCFSAGSVSAVVDVRHDGMFGSIVNLVSAGSVQYNVSIQNKQ